MRKLGGILFLAGVLGAFYSSSRLQTAEPLPDGTSIRSALEYDAGRWTLARYAFVGVAGLGFLLALFPKGR